MAEPVAGASARTPARTPAGTATQILEAARSCLLAEGYAKLSTRRVADLAGVPLSQIHYHFGGRQGLVLALLDHENARLVDRQRQMYGAGTPLWKRYEQACDFLRDDLASGYVRVLQEMISVGWSDVLVDVAREAETRFGSLGPFSPADLAGLIGLSFLGGEAVILLGEQRWTAMAESALRSVGRLIRELEEPKAGSDGPDITVGEIPVTNG